MNNKQSVGLGTNAAMLSFSNIFSLLISMLSAMLLSRYTNTYEYGTYSQILLSTGLAISIFTLGMPNSVNFFLPRAESIQEKQIFVNIYYLSISGVCLLCGLILVLSLPILKQYFHNDGLVHFWYILLLLPLTRIIIQSNSNLLVVLEKTKLLLVYTFLYNLALLLIVLAIRLFQLSFSLYLVLYIIIQMAFTCIAYWFAWHYLDVRINTLLKNLWPNFIPTFVRILKFSIPLGLGGMVATLSLELDKLVIANLMDTNHLAIYSNASKELPIAMLISSFTAVLLPKISKMLKDNKYKEAFTLWGKTTEIGVNIMSFFTISIITFAPQIIVFLYSDKYIQGSMVFAICTLILLMRSTYFGIILNVSGNTKFVFYSSLVSLLLNFTLNYVFYSIFGFSGPAIATVLSIALVNALQLIYTSKISKISIKQIFPWKNIAILIMRNILLALPFIAIKLVLQLQTGTKDIIISMAIGLIWLIAFVITNKKKLLDGWKYLNTY